MCSVFWVSPYRNVIKRKYMYNLKIAGREGSMVKQRVSFFSYKKN